VFEVAIDGETVFEKRRGGAFPLEADILRMILERSDVAR
jgi:predicted Rdx family selenoprotein